MSRTPLRVIVARPHLAAALLLGLFVLAYLWPVLIGGDILSPLSILYGHAPWREYVHNDVLGYYNPLLTDIAQSHHPWNWFARELLREGTFPAWNPHVFAGVPFFNNPQTVLLSPFSLPLWVLPLNYALGVSAALKLWAAAFGTYLLARELKLGFLPALLAGVAFALCAFNVVWLTHESLPGVSALLPWTLWLAERTLRRGGLGPAIGLAVAVAVAVAGGHPGAQVHLLAATGLFAAIRAGTLPDLRPPERLRRFAVACGAMVLGLLLVAVIFLPEVLSSHGTLGTEARRGGGGGQPGTRMPLSAVRSVLFPDWWGRPTGFEVPNGTGANFNERTFYAGVVAVLFAAMGLVTRGGWRRKAPFAVLGALGLAIPLNMPLLQWLVTHLPPFDTVQNQRAHVVFELAVAVLAAFGLQAVLERRRGERARLGVAVGALAVGVVAVAAAGATGPALGNAVEHFLAGTDFDDAAVVALTSVGWFLLFACGVLAALLALRRWPQHRMAIGAAVVLLAVADMLHFVNGYQPMAPASKLIPPRTPAVAFLQGEAGAGRFTGLGSVMLNDWSLTYGLTDVRGYDPPQPTLRFYRLWRVANPEQGAWRPFLIDAISSASVRVMNVLGVRHLAAEPGTQLPSDDSDPELSALRRVYDGSDATIFENPRAAPRALVPARVHVTADEGKTLAALTASGFDARREAVVEEGEPGARALAASAPVGGDVRVADEQNSEVTLAASLDRRGLVVLNDQLTDGWSVKVDGREADVVRVNDVMRGVVVPAGEHEVVWSYRVPGLRAGAAISGLALALVLAGTALVVVRARRRTPA